MIPFVFALQSIPPTPTIESFEGLSTGIDIPSIYNLWYFADQSVGWWNQIGSENTQVIQVIALVALIVFSLFVIIRRIRSLGQEEEE